MQTCEGHSRKLAKEYVGQHPDMPMRSLARLLRADHPQVYHSVDYARTIVRKIRGRCGAMNRVNTKDTRFFLPAPSTANPFSLPDSKTIEWTPYILPDRLANIIVMGDIHVPFHDAQALTAAIRYAVDCKADCVVLNGDIADCYALSRFDKDPEQRDFPAEREAVVQFLMALRNALPAARIAYKEGNHEARFGDLLRTKAPDLYGLSEFRLPVIFDLFNLGIDWIDSKRPIRYRELDILHGHELPAKTGGVNPARTAMLKCRSCVMVSHYHRKTGDMQADMRGNITQAWSLGCLSELHPQYMPINDWSLGFAHVRGGDKWSVRNLSVIDGQVV